MFKAKVRHCYYVAVCDKDGFEYQSQYVFTNRKQAYEIATQMQNACETQLGKIIEKEIKKRGKET